MAQIALGAVGAGIGSFFGNPMLGFSVGMTVGGILFPPHGKNPKHPQNDLRVSGSGYGVPIPQVWGNFRLAGNIIWATDLVEHSGVGQTSLTATAPGSPPFSYIGGTKGGIHAPRVRSYYYTASLAYGICRGPQGRITRVWAEDLLIYDVGQPTIKTPATSMTVYTGGESQGTDPYMAAHQQDVPNYRGLCYVMFVDLDLTLWGGRVPSMTFEIDQNGATVTVASILTDIFTQAGLTASQFDVSAGASTNVTGFVLTQRKAVSSQITELLSAYFFDLVEYDGKVRLVTRGGAPVVTVPAVELAAYTAAAGGTSGGGSHPAPKVVTRRVQDIELPQRLELSYFTKSTLYNLVTHASVRGSKFHRMKTQLSFPLVFTETQGRALVEKLMYDQWLQRESFDFVLPMKYLQYCPSDVFNLPVGNSTLRVRIVKQDVPMFGAVAFSAVLDGTGLLTEPATADTEVTPTQTNIVADTTLLAWSGNAIRDADATSSGVYFGAAGTEAGYWPGATLYWSTDGGTTYEVLNQLNDPAAYGVVNGVLPAFNQTSHWDMTNALTVTMTNGAPATTTDSDVLSGANLCLVGTELLQFAIATPVSGAQYNLTRLLRGQRGTDANWGSHVNGETFIILSVSGIIRANFDDSMRGKTLYFKAVTADSTLAATTAVSVVVTGNEWTCYAPCDVRGSRDGSQNLTVTWKRRTRSGGEMRDSYDVDQPEVTESYDVEVMDSPSGSIVKRTFSALSSPTASYTATQQTTDFGSTQSSVTVKVYQNGKYGRGYVTKATI